MDGSHFSTAPGPFAGMAEAYVLHRPPWPAEALRLVADRCLPQTDCRILDLGCGPGTLSEAFAALGYENYVGVDCEPDMIALARAREPRKNWICAYAEDVRVPEKSFDLVVFGRALHWMFRSKVILHVEEWLRPGGWVAVLNDNPTEPPGNAWLYARNAVLDRWNPPPLPPDPALKKNPFYELECLSDLEQLKLGRRFSDIEDIRLPMTRAWTRDQICNHALTLPRSNIARQSGRKDELIAEIRQALADYPEPMIESFEVSILLAKRKAKLGLW